MIAPRLAKPMLDLFMCMTFVLLTRGDAGLVLTETSLDLVEPAVPEAASLVDATALVAILGPVVTLHQGAAEPVLDPSPRQWAEALAATEGQVHAIVLEDASAHAIFALSERVETVGRTVVYQKAFEEESVDAQ